MDATPIYPNQVIPVGGLPDPGQPHFSESPPRILNGRWAALHDAGAATRELAELPDEPVDPAILSFPEAMREAGGWRLAAAEQGIEDLLAVLVPGLSALLTAHARSSDITPPALALWREFQSARDALLMLTPPGPHQGA